MIATSAEYIATYLDHHDLVQSVSLDMILKVSSTIERGAKTGRFGQGWALSDDEDEA